MPYLWSKFDFNFSSLFLSKLVTIIQLDVDTVPIIYVLHWFIHFSIGVIHSLFRWLKDEQALSGGLSVLGNGSLVLRGYQADQGVYQCSITLPGTGTLLSRVAKVVYKGKYFGYLENNRCNILNWSTFWLTDRHRFTMMHLRCRKLSD